MIIKLIELKEDELHLALQFVQGASERGTMIKDRLETLLRYQAAARRDFYRALHEYLDLKSQGKYST